VRRYGPAALGFCAVGAIGLALVIGLQAFRRSQPATIGRPHSDRVSDALFTELVDRTNATPGLRLNRSSALRVETRFVDGEVWKLGYLQKRRRTCWVLLVPGVIREGSCGRSSDIRKLPVHVSTGERPSPQDPTTVAASVVYGVVGRAVKSIRLQLSDCSSTAVSLVGRPLYWIFLSPGKLAHGVSARRLVVSLNTGKRLSVNLAEKRGLPSCT
jgi:hypothetical protein